MPSMTERFPWSAVIRVLMTRPNLIRGKSHGRVNATPFFVLPPVPLPLHDVHDHSTVPPTSRSFASLEMLSPSLETK
ncbi:hypothetical protein VN97_g1549 [Penicillium thymicola]|uniref:Uncharacterized protein n=1 Tax=Penicillium thymicola TaxID=293382 RepID=A0AAI9TQU8_PENTH|nr:hypothetical protein VN97_g1549 [Penicillium thymicola]